MDESFHKQLADQARRTLDDYQVPYQLGAWEAFERHRQPASRRAVVWYRYAAAACLLAGLLIVPLWLDDAWIPSAGIGASSPNNGRVATLDPAAQRTTVQEPQRTRLEPPPHLRQPSPATNLAEIGFARHSHQQLSTDGVVTPDQTTRTAPRRGDIVESLSSENHVGEVPWLNPPKEAPSVSEGERVVRQSIDNAVTLQSLSTPPGALTQVSMADAVARNAVTTTNSELPNRRAITWSVALSPQTAYLANGHSSPTMGGGLVSDIPLNGRFGLTTGLSVAQQTAGLSHPVYQVMTTNGSVRQQTASDARLVLLDFPLNLTYQVGKRKHPLFRVSAGLSSLALVSQRYTDTYVTTQTQVVPVIGQNGRPNPVLQTTMTNEVAIRSGSGFGGVYWGRLLNLSVGIERPLTRRMVVAVEPYLKYPLGSLTQENLRIGSAGIHLRVGIR